LTDRQRYIVARWSYSIGKPIIEDDAEYNLLHNKMLKDPILSSFTNTSWSNDVCPVKLLNDIGRNDLIYHVLPSRQKSSSIDSLTSVYDVQQYYWDTSRIRHISVKCDGWNVEVTYHKGRRVLARTRGRECDAMDLIHYTRYLPCHIDTDMEHVAVRGELILTKESFKELKRRNSQKNLTSERSSVSSALSNPEDSLLLTFKAFYIYSNPMLFKTVEEMYLTLKKWGFNTPEYTMCSGDILAHLKEFSTLRESLNYKSDGAVVMDNELSTGDIMATRIFGWKEDYYKSYITGFSDISNIDIRDSYGSHNIGLKATIYPIRTADGNLQSQIDVDNLKRVLDYKLFPGTPIAFVKVSGAVEKLDLEKTRLLRETYSDSYEYRQMIEREASINV